MFMPQIFHWKVFVNGKQQGLPLQIEQQVNFLSQEERIFVHKDHLSAKDCKALLSYWRLASSHVAKVTSRWLKRQSLNSLACIKIFPSTL